MKTSKTIDQHITPSFPQKNYLGCCWMDWTIGLCDFWLPCGLSLLLLFSHLFPSLCPAPQNLSFLGSSYLPRSFCVFVHSALRALLSPLTTHSSSYRTCTNNTPAENLDLAPPSSSMYLHTA